MKYHVAFYGIRGGAGGLNPVMRNLMNQTVKSGIKTSLIIHNVPLELDLLHPDVDVIRLAGVHQDLRFLPLALCMARTRPTHLLSNREWGNYNSVMAKLLSRASTKLIFRVGNPLEATLKRRNPLKRRLRAGKMRFSYGRAHLIICNSMKIKDDVVAYTGVPNDKTVVLNNPSISDEILDLAHKPPVIPIRKATGEKIIVAIGRLARQKSFDTLLRAFSISLKQIPSRLLLIGDGKERQNLQGLCRRLAIEKHVDFMGYQNNPYSYLKRANLFVLSSAWEGSPNCLIEALALGVPVVATDCPTGPREILQNGRYGPLVPVGDHVAMASAIVDVLSDPLPSELLKQAAKPFHAHTATREYLKAMGVLNGT